MLLEAEQSLAAAKAIEPQKHEQCITALVELYQAWHKAEPDKGYDARAAQWQAKQLPAREAATH
jgi:hypothetical protein